MTEDLCLSDFDFDLPQSSIAQDPVNPRDAARLLHIKADGSLSNRNIFDLPDLLRPGDFLVMNKTKVIPARLFGARGDVRIEILLHKKEGPHSWQVFARPGKRLRIGDVIVFGGGLTANVENKSATGEVLLHFSVQGQELLDAFERVGEIPLPPYIERDDGPKISDKENYQTIYAAEPGAVAAPTAGLHFTHTLMERLAAKGIERGELTLHVGAGTFLPVKTEKLSDHVMHSEWGEITPFLAEKLNAVRKEGRRIIPVGTTSLRLLESAADERGIIRAFKGETDIFIKPGYRFKVIEALLTNFHLPKSTLFMLVSALAGRDRMRMAYETAIKEGYRFYSYGDASFIEPSMPLSG